MNTYEVERESLLEFFERVQNPLDWKAPIDAFVPERDFEMTDRAIRFFTATEPKFERMANGWLRVIALGYRLGPAGDH